MMQNKKPIRWAVFETLAYYRVLGTPLTLTQVGRLLISPQPLFGFSLTQVNEALLYWQKKGVVEKEKGLYWLKAQSAEYGTQNTERAKEQWLRYIQREKVSQKKLYLVCQVLKLIRFIPGLRGIFVCGSVARKVSKYKSDIDFLILTKKKRVWTVRFLLTAITYAIGKKTQDDKSRHNKFCLNHIRSCSNLKLEDSLKDLYSAQEYAQMVNVYSRNNIESKFYKDNKGWMGKFIPNFNFVKPPTCSEHATSWHTPSVLNLIGDWLELLLQKLQTVKIQKSSQSFSGLDNRRIVADNGVIMFHLNPRAPGVLKKFKQIAAKYNIS